MTLHIRKCIILFTVLQFFLVSGLVPASRAALISTQALIESSSADATRSQLRVMIARDDVRAELVRLGVDPAAAENRLATLTAEELQQLQGHMQDLPAGGSALAVIGIVFLVLLILELVGVTNIFTKI
ncbi:PA2779 family protein [Desulfocastanea catecholica]